MTSADLIRWSTLHDKRARSGAAFAFVWLAGAALAGWVWWRRPQYVPM